MGSIKNTFLGGAEEKAAKAREDAGLLSIKEARKQRKRTGEQLDPFAEAGRNALSVQEQFLGLQGVPAQQKAFADFQESPGQKFLRERQEQTLIRNQTAIGGIGGANIRTALQEQGAGIASTQLGDFQNRLAGISNQGLNAATNISSIGAGISSNIQQAQRGIGEAQAGGFLGKKAALSKTALDAGGFLGFFGGEGAGGGDSGIASFFSDERLKTNIVKIDELPSGLNWYMWDWIESAKEFVGDQPRSGVIAQEAQKLFPNAISHRFGYLTVNYRGIH